MFPVEPHRNEIAIVIPAYKSLYFRETLTSIARQTCKDFHVYIGDDGSPEDLGSLVADFVEQFPITYRRFDQNLGKNDLVAHWERCVDMVQHEHWVWFFSDDDRMDSTCIEEFYANMERLSTCDIAHFNVKKINSAGRVIEEKRFQSYPPLYSAKDFCRDRILYKQQSYFVEFIFRKSKFMEVGRFQRFDLAWGSDVATCIKLASSGGIVSFDGPYVYWRMSNHNISPDNTPAMVARKLSAVVNFFEWLALFTQQQGFNLPVSPICVYIRRWIGFRGRLGISRTLADLVRLFRLGVVAKERSK